MPYYIQIRNKAFGPFGEEQLKEMKVNGNISKTTNVSENRTDWFAAENLTFLFPITAPPVQTTTLIKSSQSIPEPAEWFYSFNGTEGYGPITATAITQMTESGKLQAQSLVWKQNEYAKELQKIPQFAQLFGESFPNMLPNSSSSRTQPTNGLSDSGSKMKNRGQNVTEPNTASTNTNYADVLKKYADFSGRARRREYWNFTIINMFIIPSILNIVALIAFGILTVFSNSGYFFYFGIFLNVILFLNVIYLIYLLIILLPSLAVCVRRLHDTGNSGYMILMIFIPVIGWIILLVFLVQDSQPGKNQYGQNLKYIY